MEIACFALPMKRVLLWCWHLMFDTINSNLCTTEASSRARKDEVGPQWSDCLLPTHWPRAHLFCCPKGGLSLLIHLPYVWVLDGEDDKPAVILSE